MANNKKLTDIEKLNAVEEYKKELQKSVEELAKHRTACSEDEKRAALRVSSIQRNKDLDKGLVIITNSDEPEINPISTMAIKAEKGGYPEKEGQEI